MRSSRCKKPAPVAPPSAADEQEDNTEDRRHGQQREAIVHVEEALHQPNLPTNGVLEVSYNPVEESAHRIGRALHDIDNADLSKRVGEEVRAELGAIERPSHTRPRPSCSRISSSASARTRRSPL